MLFQQLSRSINHKYRPTSKPNLTVVEPPNSLRECSTAPQAIPPQKTSGRQLPQNKGKARRRHGELLKVGMVASLTTLVLTGFHIVKPMKPMHHLSAIAFIAFMALHTHHYNK